MWTLRVLVVVVVVATVCDSTEDVVPDYAKCASILYDRVQAKLVTDMTFLKNNIKMLNTNIEKTPICSAAPQEQDQQAQVSLADNLQVKMEILIQKIEAMDDKINEALTKMDAMENKLQMTEELATKEDLNRLEGSVAAMLGETTRYVEHRVEAMVTKAQVEELFVTHVGKVEQAVTEVNETCRSDAKLTEVLQEVKEVKKDIVKVTNETEATKEEVKRFNEQDTMQELRNMMTKVEELQGKVQDLQTGLDEGLNGVRDVVVEVYNNTQPPPPTTPPPTQPPAVVFPCEDSTFRGTNSFNVCQSAVRFNKCHLEAMSYHCCRTCTAAGHLPDMGPWRYMEANRQVQTLDVISMFSL